MYENILVFNVDFLMSFLAIFITILAPFWEDPGLPKSSKIIQNAQEVDFGTCLGRILFSRWVLGGFWDASARILDGF